MDMLATLQAVEDKGLDAMHTLNLHLWITHAEYASETDRPELCESIIKVLAEDFDFKVVIK